MAQLRRLGAETAVKDGVRRRRGARPSLRMQRDDWRNVEHGGLDNDARKHRNKCGDLRCGVIGVLGVGLAMGHAQGLLSVVLHRNLIGHLRAGRHCFHRRFHR